MNYLKDNKRFSFLYGGKDFWELAPNAKITEEGNQITFEYELSDGLKVTNVAKKYPDFDAYEWVTWFEKTGDKPSEVISELWDCNADVAFEQDPPTAWTAYRPEIDKVMKIYSPKGSNWCDDEFSTDVNKLHEADYPNHIFTDWVREYKCEGGRSAQGKAPFFNVFRQNKGVIFAIGWTGQWNCKIARKEKSVNIKTKIEDTNFRLLPGEKIRTSSIVIMTYECDYEESQNKWKRLVKKHFSLIGSEGRDEYGPLCASIWGGMKSEQAIERVQHIKEQNLPFDYIWMDAGWYGMGTQDSPDEFEGDWFAHAGDWRVNPNCHPDGLVDVRKAIEEAGMKFLLWFEPERVVYGMPIVAEHPEYFLRSKDKDRSYNVMLNLGNEEAWQYCFNTIADFIEKLNINCYRQDFNFDPLEYWRSNDSWDRQGISEIKHINGLYRLWDALLEKFPHLIIDNCASGGRRIDIELSKRSMPLWRTDAACPANYEIEVIQSHNMAFSTWMPYSGTGSGRIWEDTYRIRSSYGASLTTNYFYSAREEMERDSKKLAWLRKYLNEYLRVREYFSEDFYPLTNASKEAHEWLASQFNRPERNDGMIQVFKHSQSPFVTAAFKLRGLEADREYTITDIDTNETVTRLGKDLMENGFEVTIQETRTAKIYLYK